MAILTLRQDYIQALSHQSHCVCYSNVRVVEPLVLSRLQATVCYNFNCNSTERKKPGLISCKPTQYLQDHSNASYKVLELLRLVKVGRK